VVVIFTHGDEDVFVAERRAQLRGIDGAEDRFDGRHRTLL
jgi:hypothetical protein